MKNDEIVIGKWYIINESSEHSRQRHRSAGHYYYSNRYSDNTLYGKCVSDSRKGHKKFEVVLDLKDKVNYNTQIQEHTCRSVQAEYEGESLIPIEGTEAWQEWKDRLFQIASTELQTEQRQERNTQLHELLTTTGLKGQGNSYYNRSWFQIEVDSELFDWIADLVEDNIFNLETINLNDVSVV